MRVTRKPTNFGINDAQATEDDSIYVTTCNVPANLSYGGKFRVHKPTARGHQAWRPTS